MILKCLRIIWLQIKRPIDSVNNVLDWRFILLINSNCCYQCLNRNRLAVLLRLNRLFFLQPFSACLFCKILKSYFNFFSSCLPAPAFMRMSGSLKPHRSGFILMPEHPPKSFFQI